MKEKCFIVLALLSTLFLVSCKKFLTVNPKTEMPLDVLFSSEGGFKDALTGVYLQMKDNKTYGAAMTQTTIEQLASSWDVTAKTTEERMGLFNYTDEGVEGSLSSIYGQEYKIISSVNAILGQIDSRRDVFVTAGMYETIKSECLAIRAYCHFDILRLFGPQPSSPVNGNRLPYVTVLSNTPNSRLSYHEFQTALFKDLSDAEMLVKNIDPIIKYSIQQLKAPGASGVNPTDTFLAYRYLRMNYYAVKALQARAYLWFNDTQKAYECAKLIIDAKNEDGSVKFVFGSATDIAAKDYLLTNEHIFGLYDFDLANRYTSLYGSGILKKGANNLTINNQLFGKTGTDIRESGLWELITLSGGAKGYTIKKYKVQDAPAGSDFKQIPMLRISEMYLIAAEAAPFTEGLNYFKLFRAARNIGQLAVPADPTGLQTEILKEYRKEFYSEGQAFFAYKRLNTTNTGFLFLPLAATINYLIPLPKSEAI
ncbi:RagB/SusD family nutrient uptake outer membrane protein [Pedobacter nyackensis]|uniref:RagB/SusD family nutrient uptake outer membrane protein n=1 Tax=Pedobacter nyackensis TaxID=475255 RepID=UPI00292CD5B1|nr:RagB/SusD family nutrient uptake outer membrane protein [Pedobacter nyackensis]